MKKRILSMVLSLASFGMIFTASGINSEAAENELKVVDGSYLTEEEMSVGHTSDTARGQYLMDGECSISKAGLTRVYCYASTTANFEVNYMATIVFVDQYLEDLNEWGFYDSWSEVSRNDYYMSTAKSVTVDRGYYYRVRAHHIVGNEYPYEETASVTNGIFVP